MKIRVVCSMEVKRPIICKSEVWDGSKGEVGNRKKTKVLCLRGDGTKIKKMSREVFFVFLEGECPE